MNATYNLDLGQGRLFDARGRRFDPGRRLWLEPGRPVTGGKVGAPAAAAWVQRQSGFPWRVPVGVIGPRQASGAQLGAAEAVGRGLAEMGFTVLCGGRGGVMEAVCRGAAGAGGLTVGLLPEAEPEHANPHVGIIIATGIGEARNALIARASLCLVAIGDSFGTLAEVALGRQFGKAVIGLEGAAGVDGVIQAETVDRALEEVARCALGD